MSADVGLTRPLRIGVLGCADIAVRRMLPTIERVSTTTVEAIASRDIDRARIHAATYGARAVDGYRALIDDPEVDAVYIPVPNALHARWACEALRAGKHVLVEKPLATCAEAASQVVTLADENGLVAWENFMFLHHRQQAAVVDLITAGDIGDLIACDVFFGIPGRPSDDIRYRSDLAGGALLDVGVYAIRAARVLLGAELSVLGASSRTDPASGVDVAGSALLADRAGATATLTYGLEHSYRSEYTVWGTEGSVTVRRPFTLPPGATPSVTLADRTGGRREIVVDADDQMASMLGAFCEATRQPMVQSAIRRRDVIGQAELIDAIRAATRR